MLTFNDHRNELRARVAQSLYESLVTCRGSYRAKTGADHRPSLSITDDMPEAGGGGASANPAPAAASDDDDGGDPDPEPERRRSHQHPSPSVARRNATATAGDLSSPPPVSDVLLRLPAVLKIVPVSRSGWWAGIKTGRFPEPVRLSARCVAWRASDIQSLINAL